MMKIITPINATVSWEGYEYEGHVALNIALLKLNELITNTSDFSRWSLQIEGEEDFSILENGKYKTLHQVKLGSVSLNDSDKFAFVIGILQNCAEYGYFHINTFQKITSDFLSKSLTYIEQLRKDFTKTPKFKGDLLPLDDEANYIIIDKIKPQTAKASVYQILNYVCDDKKDLISVKTGIEHVQNALTAYESEINSRKAKFKDNNPTLNEDKCILGEWIEKYDDSKSVRTKCVDTIKLIISKEHPEWTFADLEYCDFVYDQLFSTLKKCITDFFINKIKNGKCLISFQKIYKEVLRDYTRERETLEYKYFIVRQAIRTLYDEFPNSTCKVNGCELCSEKTSCNLKEQIHIFSTKNNDEKKKLLFNLLLENPKEINNLPSNDLIKCQFLKILREINKLSITEKNAICATSNNGEFFWLSLDDSREKDILREKIQRGIKESSDKSFLYECDVLITDRLNEIFFSIDGLNVNVLEEEQLSELKAINGVDMNNEIENCNKPKIIRLVDGNVAKGELN